MAKSKSTNPKDQHQSDVLDLFRKIIGGVQLQDVTWADELEGQDRINFLRFCTNVYSDPFFSKVISCLYFPHIMYGVTKAENYEVVTFNRATANGISIVEEFFKKYHLKYKEEFEKNPEQFAESEDANKAFTPVTEQ